MLLTLWIDPQKETVRQRLLHDFFADCMAMRWLGLDIGDGIDEGHKVHPHFWICQKCLANRQKNAEA